MQYPQCIHIAADRVPENVSIAEPAVFGIRRPPVGDGAIRRMDESFEIRFVEVVKRRPDDGVIVIYAGGFLARVVQIGRVEYKGLPVGARSVLRLKLKCREGIQ